MNSANARNITRKLADLVANLNFDTKKFTFIIITESWLTKESNYGLESNGNKSHTKYI